MSSTHTRVDLTDRIYALGLVASMHWAYASRRRRTVEVCLGSPLCFVSSCPPSRVSEPAALPHQVTNHGHNNESPRD